MKVNLRCTRHKEDAAAITVTTAILWWEGGFYVFGRLLRADGCVKYRTVEVSLVEASQIWTERSIQADTVVNRNHPMTLISSY
jgi:hypothetical protein